MIDVRSRSRTYLLDLGTIYSNFGSVASFASVSKIILDVVKGFGVVVNIEAMDSVEGDLALYRVDATNVGLVGKNVVVSNFYKVQTTHIVSIMAMRFMALLVTLD